MTARYAITALVILLTGCSASHPANPTGALPGAPSLASQGVAQPFNLSKNHVVYKYPLPPPHRFPCLMATGSDKNVWFTECGDTLIGKMTQTGALTEYAIPSGAVGQDIAPGAAGTLWFTEPSQKHIGEIATATGQVTEFPLVSGMCPSGIGTGPDGNVWFTDGCTNTVGKITPTGTITEYALPTSNAVPNDIVAGPDGNLWFVEAIAQKVGMVTPGGAVTEFAAPSADEPFAIAAGPDGNLYVSTAKGIWRVTTSGVITEYASTVIDSNDIILGPDKQMWMADGLHMIEFNPKTQAFSPPIGLRGIDGLTLGGDGDVWIADNSHNDILVYEERVTTIGIRLNGELSFADPNYGFELGYAVGTTSTQTQTITLSMGESVQFQNVDTEPHSAAFLGNATMNNAPWPGVFNGSTTQSPAGTAIGTTGWATGSLNPNERSPIYETGLPGFYMIGCQYHYNTNEMRTVIIVH
jgi:streptogramin lyase/plastocyanin